MVRRAALAAVAGAAVALAALAWTGSMEAQVGPGRVQISAELAARGRTTIELPPLGRLRADTHRTPLALRATVLEVDVEGVQRTLDGADPAAAAEQAVTSDLESALGWFVRRTLILSVLAGAMAGLLLPGRHWGTATVGGVAGGLAVGAVLLATWVPYDRAAFAEPTFEGELVRVPGLLEAAERNLVELDAVRSRVDVLSDRLAELYAASAGELPGGASDEVSILHVSDLHLNPLGAELVVQLAGDLEVDAVLDTGDVTSFGFPVEARFGDLLAGSPVPYYLVPGNHDSPENRAALDAIPRVVVLGDEVVDIAGVRVLGVADPTFTATNEVSTEAARAEKAALAEEVAARVAETTPDVLAVHDRTQAAAALGHVPLVVAGHLHERTDREVEGSRLLTVGSTGATGLGSFAVETRRPYEAQVLRFREGRLVAIDYLTVQGIGGDFTLERTLVRSEAASVSRGS